MSYVDAHMHLSQCADPEATARLARSMGVALFSSSVTPEDGKRGLALRTLHSDILKVFVGLHPAEASEADVSALDLLYRDADGVGEIGLDEKYSPATEGSMQMVAFTRQLEGAEKERKPVQVHSRETERACLEKLSSFRLPSVLLHWFQGERLAGEASSRGYYVSFGPALLYSKKLAKIAASYPRDLIMTESDSPVAYAPLGGSWGPQLIPSVVFALAEALRLPQEEVASLTRENSLKFLKGERKG